MSTKNDKPIAEVSAKLKQWKDTFVRLAQVPTPLSARITRNDVSGIIQVIQKYYMYNLGVKTCDIFTLLLESLMHIR